jgi:hypothetical protein
MLEHRNSCPRLNNKNTHASEQRSINVIHKEKSSICIPLNFKQYASWLLVPSVMISASVKEVLNTFLVSYDNGELIRTSMYSPFVRMSKVATGDVFFTFPIAGPIKGGWGHHSPRTSPVSREKAV